MTFKISAANDESHSKIKVFYYIIYVCNVLCINHTHACTFKKKKIYIYIYIYTVKKNIYSICIYIYIKKTQYTQYYVKQIYILEVINRD